MDGRTDRVRKGRLGGEGRVYWVLVWKTLVMVGNVLVAMLVVSCYVRIVGERGG